MSLIEICNLRLYCLFLYLDSAFSSARERHADKTRNSLQEESLCPCNWVSAPHTKLLKSWIFNGSWHFINFSIVNFKWYMHTYCYYYHFGGFYPSKLLIILSRNFNELMGTCRWCELGKILDGDRLEFFNFCFLCETIWLYMSWKFV